MRKEKSAALKDFLPPLKVVFKAVAKTFWKRRKCKFRIVLCLILLLLFQFQLCKYRKKYVFAGSMNETKFRLCYHLFYNYECFCKQDYWGHKLGSLTSQFHS